MTINVLFDPILGKLRQSDIGVVSVASLIVTDPLIVNNLIVTSNTSINTLYGNTINASTVSTNRLISNNIANNSTISTNLLFANGVTASLVSTTEIRTQKLFSSTATLGLTHISTIDWNLTSGATALVEGQMNWDANQQTAVIGMAGGNVDLALGMELLFPRRVRNSTGSTMAKGTVVYINGVSGNTPTVERAIATNDMSSAFTLGMTAEDIANTATGWVTTFGELTGIDLSAYTGGDTLYLSGATAGAFTNVPQSAPIHYVRVGTVVKATADGALVVNILNGYELNELHNVVISSLASGQIIQSGASSLWYNRSLASAVADLNILASLGSLAYQNTVDYVTQVTSKPSLGSLAVLNDLSYTSLLNLPSLGSLAVQNTVDYVTQVTSKPSLGSLAVRNDLSYTELTNLPSLGSLAQQNTVDYLTQITNLPSLGSLAQISDVVSPLVLSGATLSLSQASIVHNNLGGLTTGDPHTQYALLAGRSGGQILRGGTVANDLLILRGTSANGNTEGNNAFRFGVGNGGGIYALDIRQDGTIYQNANSTRVGYPDTIGAEFNLRDTGGGGKTIYSHRAKLTYAGSSSISGVQATSNQIEINGGGTVTAAEILTSNLTVENSSTVVDAKLIRLFAPTVQTGGSIGTLMGLNIPNLTQGTTNWSIYSEGGDMFHKGNLGIGINPAVSRALTLSDTKNATFSYLSFCEGASEKWVIGSQSGEFNLYDSVGAAFRITVENTGNVGIGQGNPAQKLDVNGIAKAIDFYADNTDAAGTPAFTWTNDTNTGMFNAAADTIGFTTAGVEGMRVGSTQNVGIGTTTTTAAKLYVDQPSLTAAIPTLTLDQADLSEEFINFVATVGATNPIRASSTATTFSHKVRVAINGTFKWLYLYND